MDIEVKRQRGFEFVSPKELERSYDWEEEYTKKTGIEVYNLADNHVGNFNTNGEKLPFRKTKGSSGYDFYLPTHFMFVHPKETVMLVTGIRAYMQEDEELKLYIRSSVGLQGLMIADIVPKIDSDYYYSENEGNIMIPFYNYSNEMLKFNRGDRLVQGSFYNYLVSDNGNGNQERKGGFGSTGR